MPVIKDVRKIKEKWLRITPTRTEEYRQGIEEPRRDWEKAANAQKDLWKTSIIEAAEQDMFARGVAKAGTPKWRRRALLHGPERFKEGVQAAGPEFEAGFAPFVDVIRTTVLPPRFPKGDPRNLERVRVIAQALRQKRLAKR